jgi:UDP-N-acetylmuramoyl-L-alanyl-D-glutamate--2,6-diaminopimelate ligase
VIAAATSPRSPTLAAIFAGLEAELPVPDLAVQGLAIDSRRVTGGECFFALGGARAHGLSFVAQAIQNGAVAVGVDSAEPPPVVPVPLIRVPRLREKVGLVAAKFYGEPSTKLRVVAVTGTNGKTTVAHLCAQALTTLGQHCGYIGTLGEGDLNALQPTGLTTPDPIRLQADFANMLADGKVAVAIEASSHALAQFRLAGTQIATAVFTGLSHDHLDYHANTQAYFDAKRALFVQPGLRHAVLNADDPLASEIADVLPGDISLTTFSLRNKARRRAQEMRIVLHRAEYLPQQSLLEIDTPQGTANIRSRLVGDINAQNLLAALGVLLSFEIPLAAAAAALAQATPVCGRLERFGGCAGLPLIYIDYAHSPDSLERVLKILRAFRPARLICVFGCGGDRDRGKRPLMGQIAAQFADLVIVTTDNPRSERPDSIAREIMAGARDTARFTPIEDRAQAIVAALAGATAEDIVLIAGKGHETTQEITGQRIAQSDQAIVEKWLAERR